MTSATLASSEGAQGIFSKITFSKSVRSNEKDEVCHSFLVKIFTKSLHRGGVPHQFNLSVFLRIYVYPKQKEIFKLANRMRSMLTNGASKNRDSCFFSSFLSFFPIFCPLLHFSQFCLRLSFLFLVFKLAISLLDKRSF